MNTALQLGRTVRSHQLRAGRTRPAMTLWAAWLAVVLFAAAALGTMAQTTNSPAATNRAATTNHASAATAPAETAPAPAGPTASRGTDAPQRLDESAFHIIGERNIFNANRSGGRVQLPSSRPTRVETFTLVGTMAYEKGAYAFFEGTSSELTKAVQAEGVIAGHKLADIFAGSVKLEADGKQIDLPIGSQMRREDAGTWLVVADAATGGSSSGSSRGSDSSRGGDSASRSRRNGDSSARRSPTPEPAGKAPATAAPSAAEQSEILKKLRERREKE